MVMCRDPVFGRPVVMPLRSVRKVAADHPDIAHLAPAAVLSAVAAADHACAAPGWPSRHVYFRRGVGPSQWICVVVEYDDERRGTVVTAFARRRLPGWA